MPFYVCFIHFYFHLDARTSKHIETYRREQKCKRLGRSAVNEFIGNVQSLRPVKTSRSYRYTGRVWFKIAENGRNAVETIGRAKYLYAFLFHFIVSLQACVLLEISPARDDYDITSLYRTSCHSDIGFPLIQAIVPIAITRMVCSCVW